MIVADKRIKKVNECVVGVKMIKFNAWENIMYRIIDKLRREKDQPIIISVFARRGLIEAVAKATPGILALACFPLYDGVIQTLDTPKIYSLVTMFNMMNYPISLMMIALHN